MRFLFLLLAFVSFGIWLVAFVAFHVTVGLIHLLLVIGVIALILHFVRGSSSTSA